jgi:DNA-binding HxlR family transcriptional regulator
LTTSGPGPDQDLTAGEAAFALAESSQIESIVSQLESMTRRTYGQYCGLSRAMEMVGERWTMLIIRDLAVSPKSAADLQRGLPRIPEDTLTARLRELEHAGVVERRPMAGDQVGYELTAYGIELEEILLRFSRWGSQMLGDPRPEEIVTIDSTVMAMRSMFNPSESRGVHASYEIRVNDEIIVHIRVDDGIAHAGPGPLPNADLVLEPGPLLKAMMAGEISPADAIASGEVRIVRGDPALLLKFIEMFAIPRLPSVAQA